MTVPQCDYAFIFFSFRKFYLSSTLLPPSWVCRPSWWIQLWVWTRFPVEHRNLCWQVFGRYLPCQPYALSKVSDWDHCLFSNSAGSQFSLGILSSQPCPICPPVGQVFPRVARFHHCFMDIGLLEWTTWFSAVLFLWQSWQHPADHQWTDTHYAHPWWGDWNVSQAECQQLDAFGLVMVIPRSDRGLQGEQNPKMWSK